MNLLNNLFQITPGTEFSYYIPFIVLIVALIIKAVVFGRIYNAKRKNDIAFRKLFPKTAGRYGMFAALFTFLMLVRFENIPYFSMRIWLYLAILWFAHFIYKTARAYFKDYPREKMNYQKRAEDKPKVKGKVYTTSKKRK